MIRALLAALLCLVVPAAAHAEEEPRWSVGARSGWVVLGGERPTGGLVLGLESRYAHPFGEQWGGYAGLAADAIGVGGDGHWLGVIGGPAAGGWARLGDSWRVSLGAVLPYGRVPVCNDWGLCLRYWGIYPGGSSRVSYDAARAFRLAADVDVLYVDTLGWSGAGIAGRVAGVVAW